MNFLQAKNDKWGMPFLLANAGKILCVNAMWQTSRNKKGPSRRGRATWCENSLVLKLVQHAQSKQAAFVERRALEAERQAKAPRYQSPRMSMFSLGNKSPSMSMISMGVVNGFYTDEEMSFLAVASHALKEALPMHFQACATFCFMRRMVWHRVVAQTLHVVLPLAQETVMMYTLAGGALQIVNKLSKSAVRKSDTSLITENAASVSLALTRMAARETGLFTQTEVCNFERAASAIAPKAWARVKEVENRIMSWYLAVTV